MSHLGDNRGTDEKLSDIEAVEDEPTSTDCDLAEGSSSEHAWYLNGKYDRYWTHYSHVTDWYNRHMYAMWYSQVMAGCYMNSFNTWRYPPHHNPSWCTYTPPEGSNGYVNTNTGYQTAQFKQTPKSNGTQTGVGYKYGKRKANFSPELVDESDGEDCEEDVISDEMLAFFTETRKHQKEWKELQKEVLAKEAAHKRIDICQVSRESSVASSNPPSEQIGSRRSTEMKELYGKGAALIHGMETAIQLSFDRHYDLKQPKLWPNIPLNMTFS